MDLILKVVKRPRSARTEDIPNNNNPSFDAPPTQDIPRNILAFRTITKLLSRIQQLRELPPTIEETKLHSADDRQKLRLSIAFATIAVIDAEVVAIATNLTNGSLDICASAQTSINQAPLNTPSLSVLSRVWQFFFTQNYRDDGRQPTRLEPTIGEAGTLSALESIDDERLKDYVYQYW
jgi:hypothetical protein